MVSIVRAVKTPNDSSFNTELVRSVIMPDGTEHKLDYDPSKPEDAAEADRVFGALVRGENVSGNEFDNLQATRKPSLRPSRARVNIPRSKVVAATLSDRTVARAHRLYWQLR